MEYRPLAGSAHVGHNLQSGTYFEILFGQALFRQSSRAFIYNGAMVNCRLQPISECPEWNFLILYAIFRNKIFTGGHNDKNISGPTKIFWIDKVHWSCQNHNTFIFSSLDVGISDEIPTIGFAPCHYMAYIIGRLISIFTIFPVDGKTVD